MENARSRGTKLKWKERNRRRSAKGRASMWDSPVRGVSPVVQYHRRSKED